MTPKKLKVGVAGLWHLGAIYSVCFAELGHKVIAYDPGIEVIKGYQNLITPVHEPGLLDLLQKNSLMLKNIVEIIIYQFLIIHYFQR